MNVNRKQCYFIWEGNSEKVTSIYSLEWSKEESYLGRYGDKIKKALRYGHAWYISRKTNYIRKVVEMTAKSQKDLKERRSRQLKIFSLDSGRDELPLTEKGKRLKPQF